VGQHRSFGLHPTLSSLLNTLREAAGQSYQHLLRLRREHPQRIGMAVAGLMLVGAGGSYAVASLGPDAADLPVREIVQPLSLNLTVPLETAATAPALRLYRSDLTRSSDSADALLRRLGLADPAAADFVRADPLARKALLGRAGRLVTAEADELHRMQQLTVRWIARDDTPEFERLVIRRDGNRFIARQETGRLQATTRMSGGSIQTSLFAATDDARIPDNVATQLADIFAGDIDFHRALRRDDRFSVVYESLEADGEPLRAGRVLSAEFVNNGKTFQAVWFQEPGAPRGDYYNMAGQNLRRAYLASPLAFSRVTSGFKMRFHPILQTWRAHLGVDYGAPAGTPVRAVGDGVVETAGWQNGFGNMVTIKHRNGHSTVYAHLSRIDVKKGQSIGQGQTLGAVGATGWATGPHLHFEFRVNGQQKDPMLMARQSDSVPVPEHARAQFLQKAAAARVDLSAAATLQVASIQ
jgi:murein DD-endopeptidase MepM/ murein hydrolase activator NlpD